MPCKRARSAEYRALHRESTASYQRSYYSEHKAVYRARYLKRYYCDGGASRDALRGALWRGLNKHKKAAATALRRSRMRNQTPPWANMAEIEKHYLLAKVLTEHTGIPMEVDHIWPLSKGGLHVQWNLQVIPAAYNRRKGASIEFE